MQCVGEKNYKYFVLFIFTHCLLTLYGAFIGVLTIYWIIKKDNLFDLKFKNYKTQQIVDASFFVVIKYLLYVEMHLMFMTILCGVMGITLFLFLIYHLWMIKSGFTTNEKIRRSDIMA